MKKLLILIPILIFGLTNESKACFDPDTTIRVNINYGTFDSIGCNYYINDVEIRLSNLRVMNESPNKICACGLKNIASTFEQIQYLSFVDSGTNDPYNGIALFDGTTMAGQAWDNASGSGSWEGFVADVINAGLDAETPVEFIIRAQATEGILWQIDSNCTSGVELESNVSDLDFGTDAWDPILEDLDQSHQSIRKLGAAGNTIVSEQKNAQYFIDLDDDILSNIPVDTNTAKAKFSYTMDGQLVDFVNESNNNALQYLIWDFGDGTAPVKGYGDVSHNYNTRSVAYNACLYNINNGDTVDSACTEIVFLGLDQVYGSSSEYGISAYPNPASDVLNIKIHGNPALVSNVQLKDMLGKSLDVEFNAATSSINVSQVNAGIYFIQAEKNGKSITSEMIVIQP